MPPVDVNVVNPITFTSPRVIRLTLPPLSKVTIPVTRS